MAVISDVVGSPPVEADRRHRTNRELPASFIFQCDLHHLCPGTGCFRIIYRTERKYFRRQPAVRAFSFHFLPEGACLQFTEVFVSAETPRLLFRRLTEHGPGAVPFCQTPEVPGRRLAVQIFCTSRFQQELIL